MLESEFQSLIIDDLHEMFGEFHQGGCLVLKNDSGYLQGIPDLLVLYKNKWAMLEVKKKTPTKASDYEPNQEWYIETLGEWSYVAMICPENKEMVYSDLQRTFRSAR